MDPVVPHHTYWQRGVHELHHCRRWLELRKLHEQHGRATVPGAVGTDHRAGVGLEQDRAYQQGLVPELHHRKEEDGTGGNRGRLTTVVGIH